MAPWELTKMKGGGGREVTRDQEASRPETQNPAGVLGGRDR